MLKLLNYYKFLFALSGIILLAGIISLAAYGLRLGIDFKGGTVTELKFEKPYDIAKIHDVVSGAGVGAFQLQTSDNNGLIVKTGDLDKDAHDKLDASLKDKIGNFQEVRYESVGPVVGKELKQDAIWQLVLVSLAIILFIAFAFRRVQRPITSWRFGVAAVIALLHDLLIVLGIFSILGHYKGIEIDSLFVTAMLTVLGFSVHDTIVVFDRIRENLKIYAGQPIDFVVNHSITQTLVRSLNTSLTVLFVLLALLLFGGDTIKYFILAIS